MWVDWYSYSFYHSPLCWLPSETYGGNRVTQKYISGLPVPSQADGIICGSTFMDFISFWYSKHYGLFLDLKDVLFYMYKVSILCVHFHVFNYTFWMYDICLTSVNDSFDYRTISIQFWCNDRAAPHTLIQESWIRISPVTISGWDHIFQICTK